MKWWRKKPSSSSSSRPTFMSHVFPIPWFSKFKQKSGNSESKPRKVKQNGKGNSQSMGLQQRPSRGEGRFHGGDDDAFWRISFGEDIVDSERSGGVLKSVWYDSDDELEPSLSSFWSSRSTATEVAGREEAQKFSNMASETRKMRELPETFKHLPEFDGCKGEKERVEAELKIPRRGIRKVRKLREMNRRVSAEKLLELQRKTDKTQVRFTNSEEKNILELEPVKIIQKNERDFVKLTTSDSKKHHCLSSLKRFSNLRTIEEDYVLAGLNFEEPDELSAEELSSEWQKSKDMKIKEIMSKSEKQRKSLYVSRELQRRRTKQGSRVRIYSPRTASRAEICKIKALEDMKKAKMKMKKKTKEGTVEGRTELESFALVKCSFDPQQDFRDSMVEMITEGKITRPEELEELLACYLTLNSDEYHDLIIKVFRQVWFDMNHPISFNPELQDENCCYG